jgi:N-acetylglucosamine-6-phosphate deacetylase
MEAVRKAMQVQSSKLKVKSYREKNSNFTFHFSLILGVHLEGPFLNPVRRGAQDKDSFIKPAISNLKKLIEGYEDIIKIITIAPELPGALKVIEKCVSLRIKVNMGHSDATYRQALNGKKAGATGITHIFNAMRPFHHREIGLAGLGLLDEDIYIEVIADNIHLDKKTLELIFKVKPPERIILVSDSVKGAGNRKSPIYSKAGVLVGSSITLSDAVRNLKKIGIPEKVILKAAVDNPKRYLL